MITASFILIMSFTPGAKKEGSKDMVIKYYGTESETIIKNGRGELYIIQSVDFPEGKKYEKIEGLPEGAKELDPVVCQDLIIPEVLMQCSL